MRIGQNKGGLTIQRIDNKVSEHIWVIGQSMRIITSKGASPEQWNLLIDHGMSQISYLESNRPRSKWYMADSTDHSGEEFKAPLDMFMEVGLGQITYTFDDTPTMNRKHRQM